MMFFEDNQKIGIGLMLIGLFFYVIGVMWFLDRGFLAMGNFAFLMGMCAMIGVKHTFEFFTRKTKLKGSVFFFMGFALIIIGWPFFTLGGFATQMYGMLCLFQSYLRTLLSYASALPVIGPMVRNMPFLHKLVDTLANDGKKGDHPKKQ